jgi:alpha-methylacyl-CoA racemase
LARGAFIDVGGVVQAAPAPRFSRSAVDTPYAAAPAGTHTNAVLAEAGFSAQEVAELKRSGTAHQAA